jgi:hypothetical protein
MSFKDQRRIEAVLLLEVLGRPPEHILESLKKIVEDIGEEKGVTVKEKLINEPSPLKEEKELFTTFAEVEIEVEDITQFLGLIFKYMPSHIEIIEPEELRISNNNLNELFNELVRRLHGYDEVARILQNERIILETKLREVLEKGKKEGKN